MRQVNARLSSVFLCLCHCLWGGGVLRDLNADQNRVSNLWGAQFPPNIPKISSIPIVLGQIMWWTKTKAGNECLCFSTNKQSGSQRSLSVVFISTDRCSSGSKGRIWSQNCPLQFQNCSLSGISFIWQIHAVFVEFQFVNLRVILLYIYEKAYQFHSWTKMRATVLFDELVLGQCWK